ncbi:MAG: hypothetical protein QW303_01200 [Nitrososphaerota archaeon]
MSDHTHFGCFPSAFNPMPTFHFNGYDPKSSFLNHNFVNRDDIVHNNLQNIFLHEEIREYSVMIDSKDRNYQIYPDPFHYEVKFGALHKIRDKVNGNLVTYEEPNPTINNSLLNVRYIKLELAILPIYTKVKMVEEKTSSGEVAKKWKVDTRQLLTDNLYTVLSIGEYQDVNYLSTNDVLADSFATIYYSCRINDTHFLGYTKNGVKIFPQDQLARIDKLRISFMDPYGNHLSCHHVNKNIKSNMICHCKDPSGDDYTDCFKHNLFHPLNPLFQHHIQLKVGVVEPRLSKKIFS